MGKLRYFSILAVWTLKKIKYFSKMLGEPEAQFFPCSSVFILKNTSILGLSSHDFNGK